MGISSGLQSQLGIGVESTYGTRVAPTRYFEYTQEGLKFHRNRIESKAMRAGRRILHRWAAGIGWVDGGFTVECAAQSFALLMKHCIGASVVAGANPYTHTITPGALDALSLSVQVQRSGIDGTDRVFDYSGMQVTDWSLDAEIDQYLMQTVNFYGATEVTNQSLGTASYPATLSPFTFLHGSLTIAAGAYDIKKITLAGNNSLNTGRHQIRTTTPEQPKTSRESGQREYGGTITSDFIDLTAYNRFISGTEAALVLTFNAGASAILAITANVRFDGETPNIGSNDAIPEQSLPFKCVSATSDAAAFTMVLTNADAAD